MPRAPFPISGSPWRVVKWGNSQHVRLVAFFKDKKTHEKKVLFADLGSQGGKQTMLRSVFEQKFAEKVKQPQEAA